MNAISDYSTWKRSNGIPVETPVWRAVYDMGTTELIELQKTLVPLVAAERLRNLPNGQFTNTYNFVSYELAIRRQRESVSTV